MWWLFSLQHCILLFVRQILDARRFGQFERDGCIQLSGCKHCHLLWQSGKSFHLLCGQCIFAQNSVLDEKREKKNALGLLLNVNYFFASIGHRALHNWIQVLHTSNESIFALSKTFIVPFYAFNELNVTLPGKIHCHFGKSLVSAATWSCLENIQAEYLFADLSYFSYFQPDVVAVWVTFVTAALTDLAMNAFICADVDSAVFVWSSFNIHTIWNKSQF